MINKRNKEHGLIIEFKLTKSNQTFKAMNYIQRRVTKFKQELDSIIENDNREEI